jgi:hypothetical protein
MKSVRLDGHRVSLYKFLELFRIIVARSVCYWLLSYSYSMKWYSYSYSKRSRIAIHLIILQITVNRYDQPSVSQLFKQPSSTSTVALSTASLSTSTKKSDAMHDFSPTIIPQEPSS